MSAKRFQDSVSDPIIIKGKLVGHSVSRPTKILKLFRVVRHASSPQTTYPFTFLAIVDYMDDLEPYVGSFFHLFAGRKPPTGNTCPTFYGSGMNTRLVRFPAFPF